MNYNISRRDFLNGVAIGTGATLLAPSELFADLGSSSSPGYYPPTLTGLRGSHAGAFETAHALAWAGVKPNNYESLGEHYDLVVVGAGVSGLATARFYQKRMGEDAKILLLDNHDDFGGHAKRNEFHYGGQMLLGVGGSLNLETPTEYSIVAKGLLDDLGIDIDAMLTDAEKVELLSPAADSVMALRGPNGHTKVRAKWISILVGAGEIEAPVRELPFPRVEQDRLIELLQGDHDYLDDLSLGEKSAYLESVSYLEFLTDKVGLSREAAALFYPFPLIIYGPAAPRISVLEAFYLGCPGFQGMGWLGQLASQLFEGMMAGYKSAYFADGNASVARLLVQKLIPAVAPGARGFVDIATQRFDYDVLDLPAHSVRLRLNSTVVNVHETDEQRVKIDYVCKGETFRVTGDHCVLACYNSIIPHICPQLPEKQKEALDYGTKVPLIMTNVLLANGRAFAGLGVGQVTCPHDPYSVVTVAPPTSTGGYQPPQDPDEPLVVYMLGVPQVEPRAGESGRDINLRARRKIYETSFGMYEQDIREQLQSLLGQYGFEHARDIKAITVNRWPHGYAYEYMQLDDPAWEPGQAPHEIGRMQFGRISIANSDSEAYAYLNAAIDAGWRAAMEQAF